jgi:hypothetical protein
VVHLADLLEEAALQLVEEDPATARAVAVVEAAAAGAGAVLEEEHMAQTEVVAGVAVVDVGVIEDHPLIVAQRWRSTGRVPEENLYAVAIADAVVQEVEDERTDQVQVGSGQEQERAKWVVHID